MAEDVDNLCVVISVPDETHACAIVGALQHHGIRARAVGGYTSGFKAEAPGDVDVLVRSADMDRAKEVLAEIRRAKTNYKPADSPEPELNDTAVGRSWLKMNRRLLIRIGCLAIGLLVVIEIVFLLIYILASLGT